MRPAGWPDGLADPDAEDFPGRAILWLLDHGPGEWRTVNLLRERPLLLAFLLRSEVAARLDGARTAYSTARRDLTEFTDPRTLADFLELLEAQGAQLLALAREVSLVEEALRGRRWRERL